MSVELHAGQTDGVTPPEALVVLQRMFKGDRGYSPYELAVQQGFEGSEAAWLASLRGDPGVGIPEGGAPGQVLIKSGTADYLAAWSDPTGGGGGITPEQLDEALDGKALRFDKEQSLTTQQQLQALENAGLSTFQVNYPELPKVLTDEQIEALNAAAIMRVDNYPGANGPRTLLFDSYPTYPSRIGFQMLINGSSMTYINLDKATKTLRVSAGTLTDKNAVSFFLPQNLTASQRATARTNIASVGYLPVSVTFAADGSAACTTSLSELSDHVTLFMAAPGHYVWTVVLSNAEGAFAEQVEAQAEQTGSGLVLSFQVQASGKWYELNLTGSDRVVTMLLDESGELFETPQLRTVQVVSSVQVVEKTFTTQQQLQALENVGVVVMRFAASDLGRKLTDEEFERALACDFIRVDGTAHDTIYLARGVHTGGAVLFTQQLNDNAYFYLQVRESTRTISHILVGQFMDINAVKTIPSPLDPARARTARTNIASVGYLQLAASLGAQAENYPLTLTTPLAGVQAAYALFWAAPGRYRWSLTINQPSELNPFVEEAELEPLQVNGGLELLFTSKRSSRRYALVLTVEDFAVTAARVEYRMRPELQGCAQAGAAFNIQTGYWEYLDLTDLTDEQVSEMYTKWVRSGHMAWSYYNNKTTRATFPPVSFGYGARCDISYSFYNSNLEIIWLPDVVTNLDAAFYGCVKLREIHGKCVWSGAHSDLISIETAASNAGNSLFYKCESLEFVNIRNVRISIDFQYSSNLRLECIEFMVKNAQNTAPITLTFHPTLYARIPDELKASAAAKNISIASA